MNGEVGHLFFINCSPDSPLFESFPLDDRPLALWESVVLGGCSSAIAGTVMFPMDTVKARLMNGQGSSVMGIFRDIVVKQGPFALYRGLPAQLVGIMPEKALKLTLYNSLRSRWDHWGG